MGAHPVGHCFDKDRSFALKALLTRLLDGFVDGKEVVAVDAVGGDAVTDPFWSDPIRAKLSIAGCRDRVAVVAAEKDDRCFEDGREGESDMEIPFG